MRVLVLTFWDENEETFFQEGFLKALDLLECNESVSKILYVRSSKVSLQFIACVQSHIMAYYPQKEILNENILVTANDHKGVFEAFNKSLKKNTAYTVIFQSEPEMIKACWLLIATSGTHPLQIFQAWQKGDEISLRTICFPGFLPQNELFKGLYDVEESDGFEPSPNIDKRIDEIIDWWKIRDFENLTSFMKNF